MLRKLFPFFIVAAVWGLLIWAISIALNSKKISYTKPGAAIQNQVQLLTQSLPGLKLSQI
jgi:hypothetical protein